MFHAQDGWCFERQPDGSVRIVKFKDARCKDVETEVTLEPFTWCSTIASVSARGENAETWDEAKMVHGIT